MYFLNCIIYMAVLGILCFPIGRLFARIDFRPEKFPFRRTEYEKNGGLYEKLKIRSWQSKIPDVSRMFSRIVPKKRIENIAPDSHKVAIMVNETCVAELTHVLLSLFGIVLLFIWPGAGGIILFLAYVFLGNIPFILVQRYNRPRLIKMRDALAKRELARAKENAAVKLSKENGAATYENTYTQQQ